MARKMKMNNKEKTVGLKRTLGTTSLVLFGLAYLTPMVVLAIFGVIAQASKGASSAAYLVAMVAMLFTANSYGVMSRVFPIAGSAYGYVRKGVGDLPGFLAGWVVLLDYLFLPLVIWLIGGSYLSAAFPAVPHWMWIVLFVVVTSLLNILGVVVAARANLALMILQTIVLGAFVFFCLLWILRNNESVHLAEPFFNANSSIAAVVSAAAIAAYSFLGFDAVTTLADETIDPEKTVPKAVFLVAFIGGLVFVFVSYVAQLVHPGYQFSNVDSAAMEVSRIIANDVFAAFFLTGLVVAQFASGIAAQASASRLMYSMGKDRVLPPWLFGKLGERFQTPTYNILLIGGVGLAGIFMDVATSTSFINFGAFLAFTLVNVATVFTYFKLPRTGGRPSIVSGLIFPTVGAMVCMYLLFQLDNRALLIGAFWLLLGLGVLFKITNGFKNSPPEMRG